jgi:hypothetical protein
MNFSILLNTFKKNLKFFGTLWFLEKQDLSITGPLEKEFKRFNTLRYEEKKEIFIKLSKMKLFDVEDKLIAYEFFSPNPTGQIHFGRLRCLLMGDLMSKLKRQKMKVKTLLYINDMGAQLFLLTGYLLKVGKTLSDIEKMPLEEVTNVYLLRNMPEYEKDREIYTNLYFEKGAFYTFTKQFVDIILKKQLDYVSLFNVVFDQIRYESAREEQYHKEIMPLFLEKNNNERFVANGDDKLYLYRPNLESTYGARDVYNVLDLLKDGSISESHILTGADQPNHFKKVALRLQKLGYNYSIFHHLYGLVLLEHGKMSTRRGATLFLEDFQKIYKNPLTPRTLNNFCRNLFFKRGYTQEVNVSLNEEFINKNLAIDSFCQKLAFILSHKTQFRGAQIDTPLLQNFLVHFFNFTFLHNLRIIKESAPLLLKRFLALKPIVNTYETMILQNKVKEIPQNIVGYLEQVKNILGYYNFSTY